MKIISRGKGKSAIAAAAYRAGEKITNEQTGIIHDYTKKKGVAKSVIILPENAPEQFRDRSILWNAVEKVEKSSNSQLAREVELALPNELLYFNKTSLAFEYIKENFTSKGMIADVNFHNMDSHNPHVHIMLTMRPLNEDGTWGDKQKKIYHLDDNGNKIYDKTKRQYKCSKMQTTDWNERHKAEEWRESWADYCNKYLQYIDSPERVDHRSYERQGIDQIPTIHLGTVCHQMEKRGIQTERGDINRAIKLANEKLKNINAKLQELEAELTQFKVEAQQEDELLEDATAIQETQMQELPPQETPSPIPAPFEGYTKTFTTEREKKLEQAKSDASIPITPKPKATPAQSPPQKPKPKAKPKLRTLKEVDLELDIIETKLSGLRHASSIDMSYGYKIQDIQRNLSNAGFFERRKMLKEIAAEEQKRNDFYKETVKKYGYAPQLESDKAKLLAEKVRIENATGVTAAREADKQAKRDVVITQRESRDRYNAERKAKRLENPNRGKDEQSL